MMAANPVYANLFSHPIEPTNKKVGFDVWIVLKITESIRDAHESVSENEICD